MDKIQQRLEKIEKELSDYKTPINKMQTLIAEEIGILFCLKEIERIKEIWLKDHNKIVADWKDRCQKAKQEGGKEVFEKIIFGIKNDEKPLSNSYNATLTNNNCNYECINRVFEIIKNLKK